MTCVFSIKLRAMAVVFGFMSLFCNGHALAAASHIPPELAIQLAKYEFYQENYLNTLINFPENYEDPKALLLRAQALSRFGLKEPSKNILKKLVREHGVVIRGEAAFEIGRIHYQEGDYQKSLDAFKRINGLDKSLLPVYRRYHAASMLKLGDEAGAKKILDKMNESLWTGYAYQNLAFNYYAEDSDMSRAFLSLRLADMLLENKNEQLRVSEETELRSRVMLAAGQMALDTFDNEKAISFLNKVNIKSSSAPLSLYLHGLAHANDKRYRQAIQSWYRVKKYPLIEPGVPDAYLGLAYAFNRDGLVNKSIQSYLEAISVLEKEVRTLDTIIEAVNKLGAVRSLLGHSSLDELEWFLADSIATNTPKVSYLIYLLEDSELYGQVESIAEIEVMIENLAVWQHDLGVFKKMLGKRISGFNQGASIAKRKADNKLLAGIKSKRKALLKKLSKIKSDDDYLAIASQDLQEKYSRTLKLLSRHKALVRNGKLTSPKKQEVEERLLTLKGVLIWQARDEYDRNLKNIEQEIAALEREIKRYEGNLAQFKQVVTGGPDEFTALLRETKDKLITTTKALSKARKLHKASDRSLTEVTLRRLTEKRKVINGYYEESQQALAHLYERIAMEQYNVEQKRLKIEEQKRLEEELARQRLKERNRAASEGAK